MSISKTVSSLVRNYKCARNHEDVTEAKYNKIWDNITEAIIVPYKLSPTYQICRADLSALESF